MSADLLAVLATVGAATLSAAASWAVVWLVGWLLARRRRRRTAGIPWTLTCRDCERAGIQWGGVLVCPPGGGVRIMLRDHWNQTAHSAEAWGELK